MKKFIRRLFIPPGLERDATPRQRKFFIANLYALGFAYTYYVLKDMVRNDVQGEFGLRDTAAWFFPGSGSQDIEAWFNRMEANPATAHMISKHTIEEPSP